VNCPQKGRPELFDTLLSSRHGSAVDGEWSGRRRSGSAACTRAEDCLLVVTVERPDCRRLRRGAGARGGVDLPVLFPILGVDDGSTRDPRARWGAGGGAHRGLRGRLADDPAINVQNRQRCRIALAYLQKHA